MLSKVANQGTDYDTRIKGEMQMTLTSKEHYDMIAFFERCFKGQFRMDKEDKSLWSKGNVYQNSDANRAFLAFREGVAYGRAVA